MSSSASLEQPACGTPHARTSLVKAMALDDARALAGLGAPYPQARVALAAARHHMLTVRCEAAAGHCSVVPCEHLPCTFAQACMQHKGVKTAGWVRLPSHSKL